MTIAMANRPKPAPYEEEGGGETVVRLSFSVAELIKTQSQLSAQFERLQEKNDEGHEATRRMIADLRNEIRSDFATKQALENTNTVVSSVRKDTDSNTSNMNKVALLIIGAIITGAIGLLFTFAHH
jgi:cysteinyl-tRNA synthetase